MARKVQIVFASIAGLLLMCFALVAILEETDDYLADDATRLTSELAVPSDSSRQDYTVTVVALERALPFGSPVLIEVRGDTGNLLAQVESDSRGIAVLPPSARIDGAFLTVTLGGDPFAWGEGHVLARVPLDGQTAGRRSIVVAVPGTDIGPSPPRVQVMDEWAWPVLGAAIAVPGSKETLVTSRRGYAALPADVSPDAVLEVSAPAGRSDLAATARGRLMEGTQRGAVKMPWKGSVKPALRMPRPPYHRVHVWVRRKQGLPRLLLTKRRDQVPTHLDHTLPFGEYEIWAASGQHVSGPFDATLGPESTEIRFPPWKVSVVNVQVSSGEKAIAGLRLALVEQSARLCDLPRGVADRARDLNDVYEFTNTLEAVTGQDGRATFWAVPRGSYELTSLNVHWDVSNLITLTGDGVDDLGLLRAHRSSGSLEIRVDGDSRAATELAVVIRSERRLLPDMPLSADEPARLRELPRGIYSIRLKGLNPFQSGHGRVKWLSDWRNVAVERGGTHSVVFSR